MYLRNLNLNERTVDIITSFGESPGTAVSSRLWLNPKLTPPPTISFPRSRLLSMPYEIDPKQPVKDLPAQSFARYFLRRFQDICAKTYKLMPQAVFKSHNFIASKFQISSSTWREDRVCWFLPKTMRRCDATAEARSLAAADLSPCMQNALRC